MAYNESGEIPVSQSTYSLGGYTFELKVQNVHEPGEEEVVSVFAICRGPDGNRETQAVDFPAGSTVESWSVEANETEASVYAVVNRPEYNLMIDGIPIDIPTSQFGTNTLKSEVLFTTPVQVAGMSWSGGGGNLSMTIQNNIASLYKNGQKIYTAGSALGQSTQVLWVGNPNTHKATPAYIYSTGGQDAGFAGYWDAIEYIQDESLIGRFAIDLHEADPEDWDEPPSTGEPSYTLNVYVTGASAGTHNSENIPLDGEIQSVYGSGGNGGNGGGGGAGASTVIIYEFATDKAGSVNQEAYAREAGAGGPGGPGGRGADGCIIIFY